MSADPKIDGQNNILSDDALDMLFRDARSYNSWRDKPVSDAMVKAIYELTKFAPTSANCSPMRCIFVNTSKGRERLKPYLDAGNVDKTMSAPVTAILAFSHTFYNDLPKLFPHTDAKSWFVGNEDLITETAWRNGTLQAGYLIMAARALGLDCGPISGFDREGVKTEFFAGQEDIEVNFLCNIGYGDPEGLFPRSPRFGFDEICSFV